MLDRRFFLLSGDMILDMLRGCAYQAREVGEYYIVEWTSPLPIPLWTTIMRNVSPVRIVDEETYNSIVMPRNRERRRFRCCPECGHTWSEPITERRDCEPCATD